MNGVDRATWQTGSIAQLGRVALSAALIGAATLLPDGHPLQTLGPVARWPRDSAAEA